MELLDALSQTFDHTTKVIAGVRPDQLTTATPCREWDLRALLVHTIGVVTNMGLGASGGALLAGTDEITLDANLEVQFWTAADRTLNAWTVRGVEGEINIGAGPMPVRAGLSINVLDTATHSWDIAHATGQDTQLPDSLAATVLAVGQGFVNDDIRAFAGFDPAITLSSDASPTDRLVAFLGRQP